MKEVNIEPLNRWGWECPEWGWGWECPECRDWMELEDDPGYMETVTCNGCGKEYKPNVNM